MLFLCCAALSASAQKIDFDMTGRQTSEVTEAGYYSWQVPTGRSATTTVTSDDGSEMEITVNCGDDSSSRTLRSNWSKNIVQKNSRLVGDAVVVYGLDENNNTPHLTDESATMNLVLKGLSAGSHSLLAYLNITDGNMKSWAPIDVLVNGNTVLTGLMMTNQATLPSASAQAYLMFDVSQGQDVTVSFVSKPVSGETYSTSGVYLNAIVLDQPNPKTTALDPFPSDRDMHVDAGEGSLTLSWTQAESAVTNIVYIGTTADDLKQVAETSSPEYKADNLSVHNVYYWRVDQRDADGNVFKGKTWSFRPRRLAFPGAEGYGRYAIGGRGGVVYHVTSLDDDVENPQPGTFRYGIKNVSGPRTIVFDVAGTITLKGRLTCSDSYVTIAGQTAPGKGILFRGAPIGVASDGITRFIRMRRGFHNDDYADMDKGLDGLGMAGNDYSIMDHCSVGWTIDEAFSSRNAKNVTLQRTLVSEALNNANHPNYSNANHGYAATIGGDVGSYHHNLLAHNEGRNWSLSGGLDGKGVYAGGHDVFNNVVYNWGGRATDGGTHECNFVNNYYKMGPATTQKVLLRAQLEGTGTGSQSYYVNGNLRENRDGTLSEDKENDTYRYETSGGQVVDWTVFVDEPFFESYADVEPARLAYKTVLSDVGANQPVLDDHDKRMVEETLSGTYTYKGSVTGKLGLIDRETDAGGYENYPEEARSADFDSDKDGMPDWWERAKGLNPDAQDNNSDDDGDGYTALEEYLNWLAEPHYSMLAGAETKIDLHDLFAGFGSDADFECNFPDGFDVSRSDGVLGVIPPSGISGSLFRGTVKASDDEGSMERTVNIYVTSDASGIDRPISIGDDSSTVYRVYSTDGILVRNDNDLSSLPSGVYVLQARNGNVVRTFKMVKK